MSSEVGTQRILGLFSFVNIIWIVSVFGALITVVPFFLYIFGEAIAKAARALYHALIAAFLALAGVPMVLNTSFNLNKMPIAESPADALGPVESSASRRSVRVLAKHSAYRMQPSAQTSAAGS